MATAHAFRSIRTANKSSTGRKIANSGKSVGNVHMNEQGSDGEAGIITATDWQAILNGSYDSRPSILLISDDAIEQAELTEIIEGAGARLLGAVDVSGAVERLDRIAAVRLIILHVTTTGPFLSSLLVRIGQMIEMEAAAALICVPFALVDEAYAVLPDTNISLLCTPSKAEFTAALALAIQPAPKTALHDIGRESETVRLQRLSEEVSRIARTLASLSGRVEDGPQSGVSDLAEPGKNYVGEPDLDSLRGRAAAPVTAREIRDMLRVRRLRDQFFQGELFADPAWDMLLDLMAARLSGQRVSVSSLCIAAAVPATTALRWIRALTDSGLFLRQADPQDGRRVFIALSDGAAEAMTNYFASARRGGKAMIV